MRGVYLMGGYPDGKKFREACDCAVSSGFDFIEIGIPFNDPLADGPVITAAAYASLAGGATPEGIVSEIETLRGTSGLYVMTYSNIIYGYGPGKFSERLSGVLDGVILADMPNRMSGVLRGMGLQIPVVPFATLETRPSDLDAINESASDIVYFVGLRGITGADARIFTDELIGKINMIRNGTDKKIILGFGIKTGEDASRALEICDGFVVGTEAVRRQGDASMLGDYLTSLVS